MGTLIALCGVWVVIEQAHEDRRAWVVPSAVRIDSVLERGKNLDASIRFKNSGRTPATVRLSVWFKVASELTDEELADESKFNKESVYLIAPEGELHSKPLFHTPFTDDAIALANSGTHRIFLIGRLVYTDVFGGSHKTRFCFYTEASDMKDASMFMYEKGNSAD